MSGWAKIEIEFMPEMHDPNDVMLMLSDFFKAEGTGIPTAVIRLVSIHPALTSNEELADKIWAIYKANNQIVTAIKDYRAALSPAYCSLSDAKNAIDAARKRNP